jgi:hypothetical protein
MTTRQSLALALLSFLLLAGPAAAQPGGIASYQERLPEDTLFYISWDGLEDIKAFRATNPLLRLLDSPEMKANWQALKEFRQRQEKARKTQESRKEGEESKEEPSRDVDFRQFAPLLTNPGLIAVVLPSPSTVAPAAGPEPAYLYLYDITGKEELLVDLEASVARPDDEISDYDFNGITVVKTVDAKGKVKGYKARVDRWLAGGGSKAVVEAWITAVRQAPQQSLKDTASYALARTHRTSNAQLEFFFNFNAVSRLVGELPYEPSEKQPVSPQQIANSLGLNDWELVLASLEFEPERVRYAVVALHREAADGLAAFVASPVSDFPSLDFAPENAFNYWVVELDVLALWSYLQGILETTLPAQRAPLVTGFRAMVEGMLGMSLDELMAAWGTEYAQVSYPMADAVEVGTIRLQSLRDPERVLTALRNLAKGLGPRLEIEELPGELPDNPVTYFQISLPLDKQKTKTSFSIAVTEDWLLFARSQAEIQGALERLGSGPSLRDNPAFQEARSRFPADLSSLSFTDAERWLASGDVTRFLEQLTKSMVEAARREAKTEESTADASDPDPPTSDGPELKRRPAEEEPPQLEIPLGYVKWVLSATTKDARGIYHTGYIE